MSFLVVGGTLATGGALTAGVIGAGAAVAGVGLTAYNMSGGGTKDAQANALRGMNIDPKLIAQILGNVEEYKPVNVGAVVSETANRNAGEGVNLANRSAKKLNAQAVKDVMDAMYQQFGGKDAYERERGVILGNVESHLAGQVSKSTEADLSRRLLSSNVTDLGEGSTSDAMTGYLGLTKEGLQSQGQEQFQSLYNGWRQALPLINGSQILDRFTITPDNAVQSEIANAQNAYQSSMGMAGLEMQGLQLQYGANMNQTNAQLGLIQSQAAQKQQMLGSIVSGIGTAAGAYAGSRTPGTDGLNKPVLSAYPGGTNAGYNYNPNVTGGARMLSDRPIT